PVDLLPMPAGAGVVTAEPMTEPEADRPQGPEEPEMGLSEQSFVELEAVVERGIATFLEVGQALAAIRDRGLYRDTHPTWEDYCRDRWGFSARRARQLITASGTIVPVANEAQARALAGLDADEQREVWDAALEGSDHPTAADITQARERVGAVLPQPGDVPNMEAMIARADKAGEESAEAAQHQSVVLASLARHPALDAMHVAEHVAELDKNYTRFWAAMDSLDALLLAVDTLDTPDEQLHLCVHLHTVCHRVQLAWSEATLRAEREAGALRAFIEASGAT
ncbi:MAG: hypothetical protein ACR2G7_10565, partial [Acidimicrobiales bacterium]